MKGISVSKQKGIIPVRRAFEDLVGFLADSPLLAMEYCESFFPPAGSRTSRAATVGLDDNTIVASFMDRTHSWFKEIARNDRPHWDEAVGPANLIPDSISSFSINDFVSFFSKKTFAADEANKLLGTLRLPTIQKEIVDAESNSRGEFLNALNVVITLESIVLQGGKDEAMTNAVAAALKLSLRPLWSSYLAFAKNKLALRKKALEGCYEENPHYLNIFLSNPLTPGLFDETTLKAIKDQSLIQAKSLLYLLGFKGSVKRKASASRGRGAKRSSVGRVKSGQVK